MTLELSPSKVGQWTDTAALQPDAPGFSLPLALTPQLSLWRLIAQGSSLTYEGFDRRVGTRVCVKLAAQASDAAAREALIQEAALYAQVEHPCIAPIHDVASLSDGTPYVVSEFVSGQTLAELMRKAPLGTALACEVTSQLLGALGALHGAGLVLGHLSAELVFLDFAPDGRRRVRLLDSGFGRTGAAGSAFLYQSPEVLAGGAASPRSDLYALGLLLHEMLTGICPHASCAAADLVAARMRDDIGDAALLRAGVSGALARVVVNALARDPEARFASAEEMQCEVLAARADDSCLWRLPSAPEAPRTGVHEVASLVLPLASVAPPQSPLDSSVWTPDLSRTLDMVPPRRKGWKALLVGFGVTLSAGAALLFPLDSPLQSAEPSALQAPAAAAEVAPTARTSQAALNVEPPLPAAQAPIQPAPSAAVAPVVPSARAANAEPSELSKKQTPPSAPTAQVPTHEREERSTLLPVQRPEAQPVRAPHVKGEPTSTSSRSVRARSRRSSEPADLPANPY